jgi:hypothetical protein
MIPLHHESWYTFQFADDRLIPRFHLEGVAAGQRVEVYRIDPATGVRLDRLATASAGDGGWVDLPAPLAVRAGDAFVVIPGEADA